MPMILILISDIIIVQILWYVMVIYEVVNMRHKSLLFHFGAKSKLFEMSWSFMVCQYENYLQFKKISLRDNLKCQPMSNLQSFEQINIVS